MAKTLTDIAEAMKDIDFTILSTKTEGGAIAGRPMSNNREVEYDGDSWFFSDGDARTVRDIERDPQVGLGFQGKKSLFGAPGMFITVAGTAEVIRDKAAFAAHWVKDLERWWPEGVDSPGLALIRVRAARVHYWDGEDEGEVRVG